jgi:hypothetical protein
MRASALKAKDVLQVSFMVLGPESSCRGRVKHECMVQVDFTAACLDPGCSVRCCDSSAPYSDGRMRTLCAHPVHQVLCGLCARL